MHLATTSYKNSDKLLNSQLQWKTYSDSTVRNSCSFFFHEVYSAMLLTGLNKDTVQRVTGTATRRAIDASAVRTPKATPGSISTETPHVVVPCAIVQTYTGPWFVDAVTAEVRVCNSTRRPSETPTDIMYVPPSRSVTRNTRMCSDANFPHRDCRPCWRLFSISNT